MNKKIEGGKYVFLLKKNNETGSHKAASQGCDAALCDKENSKTYTFLYGVNAKRSAARALPAGLSGIRKGLVKIKKEKKPLKLH